ncbi:hypothetical protein BJX96DRAFT_175905 [Aspergillus floccosus]
MHDNAIIAVLLSVFTGIILLGIVYAMKRRARLRRELRVKRAERHILNWNRANCPHDPEAVPAGSKKPAVLKKGEPALTKPAPKAPSVSRPKSVPFHLPSEAAQNSPSSHNNSKHEGHAGSKKAKSSATVPDEWPAQKVTAADAKSQKTHKGTWKPMDAFAKGNMSQKASANEWDQKPVETKSKTSQKAEEPKEQGNELDSAAMKEMRDNDNCW